MSNLHIVGNEYRHATDAQAFNLTPPANCKIVEVVFGGATPPVAEPTEYNIVLSEGLPNSGGQPIIVHNTSESKGISNPIRLLNDNRISGGLTVTFGANGGSVLMTYYAAIEPVHRLHKR
jgi:hypothetical protein